MRYQLRSAPIAFASILVFIFFVAAAAGGCGGSSGGAAGQGGGGGGGAGGTSGSGGGGAGGSAAGTGGGGSGGQAGVSPTDAMNDAPDGGPGDAAPSDTANEGGHHGGGGSDASDGGGDAPTVQRVTIRFKAMVGTSAFACGLSYTGQGSKGTAVRPRDFRFYVQDVKLIASDDTEVPVVLEDRWPWQTPDVALIDFEDGSGECAAEGNSAINTTITGTVPIGTYKGIIFSNGVPQALNHADPLKHPAPLQVGVMTWGWLYGFKFVKAELAATGAPVGDGGPGIGLLHLGSTGCDNTTPDGGEPDFNAPPTTTCKNANRNLVRLAGFDPTTKSIVADIGALFANTDLSVESFCHSAGDTCPSVFAALGVDFATGGKLTTQTVFRPE